MLGEFEVTITVPGCDVRDHIGIGNSRGDIGLVTVKESILGLFRWWKRQSWYRWQKWRRMPAGMHLAGMTAGREMVHDPGCVRHGLAFQISMYSRPP